MLLLLLLLLACAGSSPEPKASPADTGGTAATTAPAPAWVPPDQRGPYRVGMRTVEMLDDVGQALTVELWYPAEVPPDHPPDDYGPFSIALDAHRDMPADARGAPYPLVAFSHGYGGLRYQSTFLMEHLASHGFVVAAPDHPNNTTFDLDDEYTAISALERPAHVAAVATGAWADAELGPLLLPDVYGMSGHSFGAFTSLIVAGGRVDPQAALEHCATTPTAGCNFIDGLDAPSPDRAVPDPRVAASVILAPGGYYAFGDDGLATLAAPLVIAGDMDEDLPYDEEARPTWDAIGSAKSLATIHRAGHWAFTDLCLLGVGAVDCGGEAFGWLDHAEIRQITQTLTVAHLMVHLGGDERAAPWLASGDDHTWEQVP